MKGYRQTSWPLKGYPPRNVWYTTKCTISNTCNENPKKTCSVLENLQTAAGTNPIEMVFAYAEEVPSSKIKINKGQYKNQRFIRIKLSYSIMCHRNMDRKTHDCRKEIQTHEKCNKCGNEVRKIMEEFQEMRDCLLGLNFMVKHWI